MKSETADQIIQQMDEQFRQLGFADSEAARDFAVAQLSILIEVLRKIDLRKAIVPEPEPSPVELKKQLSEIKQTFGLLRNLTSGFIKEKIPHRPGGRRSVLGTPEEQAQRVAQVLVLIGKKVKTTVALKRVAEREGISLSSMQRIWRERPHSLGE